MDIFFTSPKVTQESGTDKLLALRLLYFVNPLFCSNSYIVERQQCVNVSDITLLRQREFKKSSGFNTILPKASYFVALDLCSTSLGVVLDQ